MNSGVTIYKLQTGICKNIEFTLDRDSNYVPWFILHGLTVSRKEYSNIVARMISWDSFKQGVGGNDNLVSTFYRNSAVAGVNHQLIGLHCQTKTGSLTRH